MSTREQLEANRGGNPPAAGDNTSGINLELPSSTIEDIDRALFNLFDKDLPLTYSYKKEPKKIPIVFASGERFALIARKKPLRDKAGALILPIISIMRTNVTQDNEMGMASNTTVPHIIKKRLSKKDPRYQRLLNKTGLKNSDDLATGEAFMNDGTEAPLKGASPGRVASRRGEYELSDNVRSGNLLTPKLDNNIFEVIEMPPPTFITATYDITIWAQYVIQMNDIVMAIMTNAQNYAQRTFRIESAKGYSYVAYMDSSFDPANNFDDFTDDERIVRTSFTMKVPGFLLGETYPGAPNRLRSILSQPQISFEMDMTSVQIVDDVVVGSPSGDPGDYVLDDSRQLFAPLPGGAVAGQESVTYNNSKNLNAKSHDRDESAMIGGAVNDVNVRTVESFVDPFTGKTTRRYNVVKTRTNRSGETIYREIF
jgi:hypothetical protein